VDSDKDGISDIDEIDTYGTDADNMDTDGDGINDGVELAYWGSNWNKDFDGDGRINLLDEDSDNDGFDDGLEINKGYDPADPDDSPPAIYPGLVKLAWDPNIEVDLAGYKVYYGNSSKNYKYSVDVGNFTSCSISGLEEGKTYFFAATAYDTQLNESNFSKEIPYTVPILDTDGDGISDSDEISIYGTDPDNMDTDSDGIDDGEELNYWGQNWDADNDDDGIINILDQDSDNDTYTDGYEVSNGYDPSDPDSCPPVDPPPLIHFEVGEIQINHNWIRVDFQEVFDDPIVIARAFSLNGGDPGVVRIRNIDSSGFEIRVQEWDYLNGSHVFEMVGYIVVERGKHALADGTLIEAGSFETDKTNSFGTVSFDQPFNDLPVVLSAIVSFNGTDTVTGRIRKISIQGFEFCMQEQESNPKSHLTETINYIAWEPCTVNVGNFTFEVGTTGDIVKHGFHSIQFDQSFMSSPVFMADMQTADGSNTANVRWQNKNTQTVEVQIDEEQSSDTEIKHTTESVGYMVFGQ
jgi:hypothetical protein